MSSILGTHSAFLVRLFIFLIWYSDYSKYRDIPNVLIFQISCGDVDELTPRGVSTVLLCNCNFKAIFIDCITVLLESWNNEAYQSRNGHMCLETCLWSITRNWRKVSAHFQCTFSKNWDVQFCFRWPALFVWQELPVAMLKI